MVSQKTGISNAADVKPRRGELSAEEREKFLKQHLPPDPDVPDTDTITRRNGARSLSRHRRKPIRSFLKSMLHLSVYLVIHAIFGIYIHLRQWYHAIVDRVFAILYYHHRTPELIEKDVKDLSALPEHLSVILTMKASRDGGLEALIDDVSELSAWCASAGIPILSVYEQSGILKPNLVSLHSLVSRRLRSYFGSSHHTPHLRFHAPNYPSHPNLSSKPGNPSSPITNGSTADPTSRPRTLDVLLLSSIDGRDTLVDLARTLAEKSQSHKLQTQDITQDLVNDIISATTSIPHLRTLNDAPSARTKQPTKPSLNTTKMVDSPGDPDLLIIFGPYVKLDGYPPWQLRLTEIFCVGDSGGGGGDDGSSSSSGGGRVGSRGRGRDSRNNHHHNSGTRVEYQAFLRALWKFARAEVRFGR